MKNYLKIILIALFAILVLPRCTKFPVDEDGLLITGRAECYVSNFEIVGTDYQSVRTNNAANPMVIDTVNCTIKVEVYYGTDLKNLYPQFTLVNDAKLEPKVTGFTDFSDLNNPKKYTVISGNHLVRKTYTLTITVQQKP